MLVTRNCPVCGAAFTCAPAYRKTFCSHGCYGRSKRKTIERTCKTCGKPFTTIPAELRKGGGRFCSRKCLYESGWMAGANHWKWDSSVKRPVENPKQRIAVCHGCQRSFGRDLTRQRKGVEYCSQKCRSQYLRQHPDEVPNWKGGVAVRHHGVRKSWEYSDWRKAVMRAQDYTCQRCGQRGGRLQVHHLRTFAEHPELRLDPANGHTLCVSCHSSIKGHEAEYLASL